MNELNGLKALSDRFCMILYRPNGTGLRIKSPKKLKLSIGNVRIVIRSRKQRKDSVNSILTDYDYNHFEHINQMLLEIDKNDFMISLIWLRK